MNLKLVHGIVNFISSTPPPFSHPPSLSLSTTLLLPLSLSSTLLPSLSTTALLLTLSSLSHHHCLRLQLPISPSVLCLHLFLPLLKKRVLLSLAKNSDLCSPPSSMTNSPFTTISPSTLGDILQKLVVSILLATQCVFGYLLSFSLSVLNMFFHFKCVVWVQKCVIETLKTKLSVRFFFFF